MASASERRKTLLEHHAIPFTVIPNRLDKEVLDLERGLKSAIRFLAIQKAVHSQADYQGLILGVDTVVVFQNQILGKPRSISMAKAYLKKLSGKTHLVISGVALVDTFTQRIVSRTCTTMVKFRPISNAEIDYYCTHYSVLDKAGGYAIQEYAGQFVESICGDYENVIGLPVRLLKSILENRI